MKKIAFLILILFVFTGTAFADKFQFLYISGDKTDFVPHSCVKVYENDNDNEVFTGYTDKFGRIIIDLSKGKYKATINDGKILWRVGLEIRKNADMQIIYLVIK